jgi:glutamyl-tRNA synthetase
LHLGNARTFLINWLLARQNNWSVILRIEDLDGPRVKPGAAQEAIEDLRWLGLDWDSGPVYQSTRLQLYQGAIDQLLRLGHAYPCVCSRKEAQSAASAPHAEDGAPRYPGTCWKRYDSVEEARRATGKEPAIRLHVPEIAVEFPDNVRGHVSIPMTDLGDFVIAKADGTPGYQLAVVVDDVQMRIAHVVRGDDLLESTARQICIYRVLGFENCIPQYTHLPLVLGKDGLRLAKRHGDSRLSYYRSKGVRPETIIALLARWCGIQGIQCKLTARELIGRFELSHLSPDPIVFSPQDDAALLANGLT